MYSNNREFGQRHPTLDPLNQNSWTRTWECGIQVPPDYLLISRSELHGINPLKCLDYHGRKEQEHFKQGLEDRLRCRSPGRMKTKKGANFQKEDGKFWETKVQHDHNYQYCIIDSEVVKWVDRKCSHHTHQKVIMWGSGSVNKPYCGKHFATYMCITSSRCTP